MTHKHHRDRSRKGKTGAGLHRPVVKGGDGTARRPEQRLEIVLKCDSAGTLDASTAALARIVSQFNISIVHSGVGAVSKSDVLLAETASRLIVGFQVEVVPALERVLREHSVEVRLYDVIYTLSSDLKAIAESLAPKPPEEQVVGSAKVIALFKSSRHGVILGCEVMEGVLAAGERFRIISAMGPVYSGTLESMHIEDHAVQKATPGQKVGIKIRDFDKAKIGDLLESFRPLPQKARAWQPRGEIVRKTQSPR